MDVVEHVPAGRLRLHAVSSPFPMDVTYELEPSSSGTTAHIRIEGEARGLYRAFGPLTAWMVGRTLAADLRRLKQAIEGQPRLTPILR